MSIGRNDPCPCNSGKKFKKCCLISSEQISLTKKLEDDIFWENWFKEDEALGQKNMTESIVNPPFAKDSEGEKLFNEMMKDA